MTDTTISFATIVATPTPSTWSQAYNAGKLYAVLSLTKSLEGEDHVPHLASQGKEIISVLQQEYFTLEEKKLHTIKAAVLQTIKALPKDIEACLIVGALVDNILYVFIHGAGSAYIRRLGKLGTILLSSQNEELVSASGYLKHDDIIILATNSFIDIVPASEFSDVSPAENAEILSPKIHKTDEGTASATVIRYQEQEEISDFFPQTHDGPPIKEREKTDKQEEAVEEEKFETESIQEPYNTTRYQEPEEVLEEQEEEERETRKSTSPYLQASPFPEPVKRRKSFSFPKFSLRLSHTKKIVLTIAIILIALLVISISLSQKKQQNAKIQALYEDIYPRAQKKYEDGQALEGLNKPLAREDYLEAQKILQENKDTFPKGTKEKNDIDALSKKVADSLGATAGAISTTTTVSLSDNPLLATVAAHKDATHKSEDETNFYLGTDKEITAIDKKTRKEKTLITNINIWKALGGIGAYVGNMYVLDKNANQIYKFVGANTTSKTNYLLSETDLSKATDMAIDGSIYILFSDGSIKKYTRGKADSFSLNGLTSPLLRPTRILTSVDLNNLYILDPGNNRIVVLSKDGTFQNAYTADVLKNARDIAVSEKDKTLFILSKDKLYKLELK